MSSARIHEAGYLVSLLVGCNLRSVTVPDNIPLQLSMDVYPLEKLCILLRMCDIPVKWQLYERKYHFKLPPRLLHLLGK